MPFCRARLSSLWVWVSLLPIVLGGVTIEVPEKSRVCFYERIEAKRRVNMEVFATKSGNDPLAIRFQVRGPTTNRPNQFKPPPPRSSLPTRSMFDHVVAADKNVDLDSAENQHFDTVYVGVYNFCLINDGASLKQVRFDMNAHALGIDEAKEHAEPQHFSKVEQSMITMSETIDKCVRLQQLHKERFAVHHHTVESNNQRVQLYSVMEFVVLAVVMSFQICVVQSWFKNVLNEYEYTNIPKKQPSKAEPAEEMA